jgi:phosphatidylglycerophosphate synthase
MNARTTLPNGSTLAALALSAAGLSAFAITDGTLQSHGLIAALAFFLAACAAIAVTFPPQHDFGWANSITLIRVALTAMLAGLTAQFLLDEPLPGGEWKAAAIAGAAFATDGVDGWIARRRNTITAFGARFDMEADAALIMVTALLCWTLDKAGAWILLSGLLRYAFVLAGLFLPALRAPLFPSFRRKAVCVAQVLALVLMLVVDPLVALLLGAASLAALLASFAVDVAFLLRTAQTSRI